MGWRAQGGLKRTVRDAGTRPGDGMSSCYFNLTRTHSFCSLTLNARHPPDFKDPFFGLNLRDRAEFCAKTMYRLPASKAKKP